MAGASHRMHIVNYRTFVVMLTSLTLIALGVANMLWVPDPVQMTEATQIANALV